MVKMLSQLLKQKIEKLAIYMQACKIQKCQTYYNRVSCSTYLSLSSGQKHNFERRRLVDLCRYLELAQALYSPKNVQEVQADVRVDVRNSIFVSFLERGFVVGASGEAGACGRSQQR